MRDKSEKLIGWDLPYNHFDTNISNFFDPLPEEIPEVKYLNHHLAMFGGTPGTLHLTKEGMEFIYFNHGSKAFEKVKISPAHARIVIRMERKAHVPPEGPIRRPERGE
jgi:hypothetical protein